MKIILELYRVTFLCLVKDKKLDHEEASDEVSRLLIAVLLTSLLMWSYSFNSLFYINCRVLTTIGFTCTLLHLFSPLIYKFTGSVLISVNFFIGVGFIFQYAHAFHSGGFYSGTTIWFSILPLISGIILGINLLIAWSAVAIISALSLLLLDVHTSNILVGAGKVWAQMNIVFGYVMVNYVLIYLFMNMKEQHKERLLEKNKSIKKLLLIVSHDISNPLTVVLLRIKMLRECMRKGAKADVEKCIAGIEKSSEMIKEILDNTRNLMAIEAGKIQNPLTDVPLNEVIESSLFVFKDKLEDKGITVHYDFEANKNISLCADRVSIKNQVFNNLFSNSIKFMDNGGEIKITALEAGSFLELYFEDSGHGMEPDVLNNIFRSDVKTSRTGTDGEKGTGFGLPILHATLSDIGATISVKSNPKTSFPSGHGTIFSMKFSR